MRADPHRYLTAAARRRRHVWREYDRMRAMRGAGLPDWPEWCFCPLAASYAIVSGGSARRLALSEVREVAELGALAAWRPTQGVYRFDPDLARELAASELTGDIPGEILQRLPAWCVYVETGELGRGGLLGYFAHLEHDANDHRGELRLLLDDGASLWPVPIHLGGSLEDGVRRALEESARHVGRAGALDVDAPAYAIGLGDWPGVAPLVSLVLYLCSTGPDLGDVPPARPRTVQGARGPRVEPPPRPTVHETGYRIGAALRSARERTAAAGDGTHASPRPHVRRAHWHTYWTGPGRATPALRWLSPMLVGTADVDGTEGER